MANNRQKKKAIKTAKKVAKKNPTIFIVFIVLVLIVGGIFAALYFTGTFNKWMNKDANQTTTQNSIDVTNGSNENGNNPLQPTGTSVIPTIVPSTSNESTSETQTVGSSVSSTTENHHTDDGLSENIIYDNFQIHFMELGNKYTGDSTYIKAGDIDILIDAGSRGNSSTTIVNYVKQYCTDGKLEYVIATHSHQDHIAGFAGTSDTKATNFKNEKVGKTGVLYFFEVGTLIDFAYKGEKSAAVDNKTAKSSDYGASTEYGKYLAAREYAISKGANYYTAKELWNNNNTTFTLADGITMDILYNHFYFNAASNENDYSVCTMFNYNDKHFLLTGDLEHDGEEKLVEHYGENLPHCELFKGGHHGSYTASNECLLEKITPSICCVCCCAGATEYTPNSNNQFPSQDFINRIAKYTSRVYITTLFNEETLKNESMNGNIIISFDGESVGIAATNNLTRLKNTAWFNADIYVDSSGNNVSKKGNEEFYTSETPNVVKVKRRTWPANGV